MEKNGNLFLQLPREEQKAIIEAIIFASDEIVSFKTLYKLLITNESLPPVEVGEKNSDELTIDDEIAKSINFTPEILEEMIRDINQDLINTGRPYQIVNYANGYQFATLSHYGQYIYSFLKSKTKRRLSQASLETLAIIAYRQPITKAEVEQIRGVNSGEIINSLVEKNLVRIVGRKEVLGKPLLFGTTQDFLKIFGLRSLEDLPKLREIDEIAEELAHPQKEEEETVTFSISKEEADKILRSSTKIELDNQDELQ
ncbi:MAG TPA: SMC-Scp complex subunit ScpB [Candidatus Kapabacteria bacterium]|nr:SMC-Scp complex subunit ScpB [Candidatus Kapabacteria bacterium]